MEHSGDPSHKNKPSPLNNVFWGFFYIEKDLASARSFSIKYEQRGWEKFFHGQTKGYMFACDQLHAINIS